MRIKLTLENRPGSKLSLHYQYEFSSAIYKILSKADPVFSEWLHNTGYTLEGRRFKLFTFSRLDFGTPFRINRDEGTVTLGGRQQLLLSFFVPGAVEKFVAGVFQDQKFGIGTKPLPPVDFSIQQVELTAPPVFQSVMRFRTLSPIVMPERAEGYANEQYRSPEDAGYERLFFQNLAHKYESARQHGLAGELAEGPMRFRLLSQPQSRLVTIKAGTPQETRIRGFDFEFELEAPADLLRFGYYAGFGEDNAQGFGMVW